MNTNSDVQAAEGSAELKDTRTPLAVGIVGAGYISAFHAHAIGRNPRTRLAAVADLNFAVDRELARGDSNVSL